MQLVLDLVSTAERSAAQKSAVTFRQAGGTIGRSETATWVLADRSRHISGVHAEISYEDGVYYLTDRSTNGTYDVNKNARLQKNEEYPIEHGDSFRMGDFVFKARVLQAADHFAHQSIGDAADIAALIPDDEFLDVDPGRQSERSGLHLHGRRRAISIRGPTGRWEQCGGGAVGTDCDPAEMGRTADRGAADHADQGRNGGDSDRMGGSLRVFVLGNHTADAEQLVPESHSHLPLEEDAGHLPESL